MKKLVSGGYEIGSCGFGFEGGLFPRVRIGIIEFWWCRGSLRARMAALHCALADARKELDRLQ